MAKICISLLAFTLFLPRVFATVNEYPTAEILKVSGLNISDNNVAVVFTETDPLSIIPQPVSLIKKEGFFTLNNTCGIELPEDAEWRKAVKTFQNKVRLAAGFDLSINVKNKKQYITIKRDLKISNAEGYVIEVTKKKVEISASDAKGVFYAMQTLLQLLPEGIESRRKVDQSWPIACCVIKDEPRYPWRGMHLDVGRHFFSVEHVKRYIDLMSIYKFNRFHWHLTEDQGWRIEIQRYPKLTDIGAYRNGTIIGKQKAGEEHYDGQRYGGYYTQEEVREVVQYAADRFVTVVPEIEMPGHSLAALAAYPELSCDEGPFETATKWGTFRPVFCPKEETFQFIENVLTEVIALFPGEYIHIGGDEVIKESWEESEFCQNLMKKEKLENEMELQSYFISRIDGFLQRKNKKMIGWDEILEGGLSPNAIVMSWRGDHGGIEAAKMKHEVIMSPESYCYFNFYQVADKAKEPLAFDGLITVRKIYGYDPTPEELLPEQTKYVIGAQANLWTEYISNIDQLEYQAYPRALALAEVVWSPQDQRVWKEFKPRLKEQLKRLDVLGVNYAKHLLNN
ncbi:MAG: beta-N-acetylhexosaminidase [Saprospiraceae bacterium]